MTRPGYVGLPCLLLLSPWWQLTMSMMLWHRSRACLKGSWVGLAESLACLRGPIASLMYSCWCSFGEDWYWTSSASVSQVYWPPFWWLAVRPWSILQLHSMAEPPRCFGAINLMCWWPLLDILFLVSEPK